MSKQTSFPKVNLLGVEVDAVTMKQAAAFIVARAADRSQPAGYVVKPYVEFLDRADEPVAVAQDGRTTTIRALLNDAELSLADGVALLWAAHFLYGGSQPGQKPPAATPKPPVTRGLRGLIRLKLTLLAIVFRPAALRKPLPERFAGTNFAWPMLEAAAAAATGLKVFLIGSPADGSIEQTAAAIRRQLPGVNIVGLLPGRDPAAGGRREVTTAWLDATAAALNAADPDLTLVGMGFPLQERVMAALAPRLSHGLLVGEGGTFDYESFGGRRPKAPALFQATGTEWLWRLILEPRRLKRQLAIPRFIWKIWRAGRNR